MIFLHYKQKCNHFSGLIDKIRHKGNSNHEPEIYNKCNVLNEFDSFLHKVQTNISINISLILQIISAK